MRLKLMVSGLVGLLALAPAVLAQLPSLPPAAQPANSSAASEIATVIAPDVEVRSGGSAQFYPTSKLRQGDRVQVVRESTEFPGWLAIKPPPGSFSWVNGKAIVKTEVQNLVFVYVDDAVEVPVLAGSTISQQSPNATVAKIKRGTILTILDKGNTTDSGTWFPIAPTPGEVRYIPANVVQRNTTSIQTASAPLTPPAGSDASDERKMLQKALDGSTDPAMRQYFQTKLNQLPQGNMQQAGHQVVATPTSGQGQTFGTPPSGDQNKSLYNGAPPVSNAAWTTYGILRSTAIRDGQQPMYALLDARGLPITYVTTQPGMSLESYIGRTVALYGSTSYRSNDYIRNNVLIATHVAAAQ